MNTIVIRTIGQVSLLLGLLSGQALAGYDPPTYAGTGPYHRVYSDTGYSYMSANVFLPGASQITIASGSGDTPYVYTGGWGNLSGAGAVDAGFQYSPTYHNWALFESGAGNSQTGPANGERFAASQTVSLAFAVVASGTAGYVDLVVTATGTDGGNYGNGYVGNGQLITETVTILVNTASQGWSVGSNNQNTLKRMTSIGQSTQNLADGSSISGVVWSNVTEGQTAADATAWAGGGSQSYPGTPGIVNVNYVDPANETDSIVLTVPEPQSWAMLAIGQAFGLGYYWRKRSRRAAVAPAT